MANIYICEKIKNRIENNSHYGECFNGDVYKAFCSKRQDLRACRNCYDEVINTEIQLINRNNKKQNLEKQINDLKATTDMEYKNTVEKYKNEEEIKSLEYDNEIENIKKSSEINTVQNEKELKLLDEDISNLKVEIEQLKIRYEKEVDYKKKNKLNEIKNEYKLKLIKYQNKKEKEKEKREADWEIKKKEFNCQKELEINDMKNKSLLAQKLMLIFKTTLLNN